MPLWACARAKRAAWRKSKSSDEFLPRDLSFPPSLLATYRYCRHSALLLQPLATRYSCFPPLVDIDPPPPDADPDATTADDAASTDFFFVPLPFFASTTPLRNDFWKSFFFVFAFPANDGVLAAAFAGGTTAPAREAAEGSAEVEAVALGVGETER